MCKRFVSLLVAVVLTFSLTGMAAEKQTETKPIQRK